MRVSAWNTSFARTTRGESVLRWNAASPFTGKGYINESPDSRSGWWTRPCREISTGVSLTRCNVVESVPLSQDNQDWVRQEIRQAIHPSGFRKAADVMRYWAVLGVIITAFLALIAMVVTLVIFSTNKVTQEAEFRGTTGERLKSIETRLSEIETTLLGLRAAQAASKPTDKASIAQAKEVLATAQRNSLQIPADVIEQSGKNFIEAAIKDPAAWDAALRFVDYRSYLNLSLKVLPSNGAPLNTQTQYTVNNAPGFPPAQLSVVGLISQGKAARFNPIGQGLTTNNGYGNQWIVATGGGVSLDGYEFKNAVLTGVHVVYMGGSLQMENVYFINCTFDFVRDLHGQEIAANILSNPAVSLTIS